MPASQREWTREMLNALPDDGNRYELIDGELLVTPVASVRHQSAVGDLYDVLKPYCKRLGFDLIASPAAVIFSERREVQPDLFVVPHVDRRRITRWEDVARPLLVVEVVSPSTARADRYKKRRIYQAESVPEYWIVDTESRIVERWRPADSEPEILQRTLTYAPTAEHEPLTIDLRQFFAHLNGEDEPDVTPE